MTSSKRNSYSMWQFVPLESFHVISWRPSLPSVGGSEAGRPPRETVLPDSSPKAKSSYLTRAWELKDDDDRERFTEYKKLQALDTVRKRLLHTQACDGTWNMLKQVSGSVLRDVIFSIDMLASAVIYAGSRIALSLGYIGPIELGEFRGLSTMGVLLAFMITFYTNTCIERLFQTNRDAMCLVARINNIAVTLRGTLFKTAEQEELTRRCIDYLCAAQAWAYIGCSPAVYKPENLWEGFNAEFGVLTPSEEELVNIHRWRGGSRYRECLAWVMQFFDKAVQKGFIAPPIASALHMRLTEFQDSCQALFDFRYMPIPFVSEHLLVLFMHIYLPIQTFEMALQTEVLQQDHNGIAEHIVIEGFGFLLAFLANMGFQGLFHVGAALEEPYSDSLSAARVSDFCRLAVMESRRILTSASPGENLHVTPKELHEANLVAIWQELESSGVKIAKLSPALGIRTLQELLAKVHRGEPFVGFTPLYSPRRQDSITSEFTQVSQAARFNGRASSLRWDEPVAVASARRADDHCGSSMDESLSSPGKDDAEEVHCLGAAPSLSTLRSSFTAKTPSSVSDHVSLSKGLAISPAGSLGAAASFAKPLDVHLEHPPHSMSEFQL